MRLVTALFKIKNKLSSFFWIKYFIVFSLFKMNKIHIQIPAPSYIGLIFFLGSISVATASWSTVNGTLGIKLLHME